MTSSEARPERDEPTATLRLRLPDSVHRRLSALARREGVTVEALAREAVLEKLAAREATDDHGSTTGGRDGTPRKAAVERFPEPARRRRRG